MENQNLPCEGVTKKHGFVYVITQQKEGSVKNGPESKKKIHFFFVTLLTQHTAPPSCQL